MSKKIVEVETSVGTVKLKALGPVGLTAVLKKLPVAGDRTPDELKLNAGGNSSLLQDIEFMIDLVCACSVEPRITRESLEDALWVDDIPLDDFNRVGKEALLLCGLGKVEEEIDPLSETETLS